MEEYIRMCDCPEVQEKWEPKIGDRMLRKFDVFGEELDKQIWPDRLDEIIILHYRSKEVSEFWGAADEEGNQRTVKFDNSDSMVKTTHIWLPRIEDILGWLGDETTLETYSYMDDDIGVWGYQSVIPSRVFKGQGSPEKALLMAYMYREHNKTWNGKEWI